MSSKYSSSSDRRRESSSRSRRDDHHRSRRSPSPGPSRRSSPKRDDKVLPKTFGRREEMEREIDDLNILQRMKTSFENSPLQSLYAYMKSNQKVKIWTRNYKEVRGVMTGYISAFDKHWNMILKDVDEVFLKHKKSKTPFLREVTASENLPDFPAKVPRQKKTEEEKAAAKAAADAKASDGEGEVKVKTEKKNRKKKKNKNTSEKRHIDQLFIRGDNVVMVTPVAEEVEESEAREEEEDDEEQQQVEAEEGEHEPGSA